MRFQKNIPDTLNTLNLMITENQTPWHQKREAIEIRKKMIQAISRNI
jgi:hypothetical protein